MFSPNRDTTSSAPPSINKRSFIAASETFETCRKDGPITRVRPCTGSNRPNRPDDSFSNSSPDSWKRFFLPARSEIGTATLTDEGWRFETPNETPPRYALIGVRACDLAAIAVQDRVFRDNQYADHAYKRRREASLIIAVNCSTSANTCFCTSMNTGPECEKGFDLLMTETDAGYVIRAGSLRGRDVLEMLETVAASNEQIRDARHEIENARQSITNRFNNDGTRDDLLENLDHPHWSDVAEKCLSCANCTMVCPTCFCNTVEEESNLSQTEVTRVRQWDSCFNSGFSYTAGGTVRADIRSRYRQWLTHKLATWEDQFDVAGCVGCGRCVTWCPVGIDLTDEVNAIREKE